MCGTTEVGGRVWLHLDDDGEMEEEKEGKENSFIALEKQERSVDAKRCLDLSCSGSRLGGCQKAAILQKKEKRFTAITTFQAMWLLSLKK